MTRVTPCCLLLLVTLPAFALELRTDRIRYRPGEAGTIQISGEADGELQLERRTGIDQTLDLGRISSLPAEIPFDPGIVSWGGGEIVLRRGETIVARDSYVVAENLWQVAIMRGWPPQQDRWNMVDPDPAAVAEIVRGMDDEGITGWECFFWGECDMLDYTPEQERFFGGQGGYPSTVSGHRALIAAGHARGMGATFYANLWGGSGNAGLEQMRRHPELHGNANYHTLVLDSWDLLGAWWDMGEAAVRAPGLRWNFSQIALGFPEPLFRRHAAEIVASQRQFGWDGIRYDSYYTQHWNLLAIRLVRELVAAELPDFRFGFNSIAPTDYRGRALASMVGGGGLVMGEDIRPEREKTLSAYVERMLEWRELVRPFGGHFGMIYNGGDRKLRGQQAWLAASLLAVGAHPYYQPLPEDFAAFNAFALRHAELLWDLELQPLADPAAVLQVEGPLLLPQALARYRRLPDGRQRLLLHLINADGSHRHDQPRQQAQPRGLDIMDQLPPAPARVGEGLAPPLRDLALRLRLPPDARGLRAWSLRADPQPRQEPLAIEGGLLRVPEVALWNLVVVEWQGEQTLATPPDPSRWHDSYLQHWQVLGPFASSDPLGAFDQELPPEATPGAVDLAARHPGRDGAIGWRPCVADTPDALGPLPLDFNRSLDERGYLVAGFAYTEIESERERDALLHWKADDTLELWLNGERLLAERRDEVQTYPEAQLPIRLRAGSNRLLIKVVSKWNAWTAYIRLAETDGRPLTDGVRYWSAEDLR